MKITIDNDADGHGNPQIEVELGDGTRLYLTENDDADALRVRKLGPADHSPKDQVYVQPVCSNVVEVG